MFSSVKKLTESAFTVPSAGIKSLGSLAVSIVVVDSGVGRNSTLITISSDIGLYLRFIYQQAGEVAT